MRRKKLPGKREPKLYVDFRDWWIGYYCGTTHHYLCLFPTIVIRWNKRFYALFTDPATQTKAQEICNKFIRDLYDPIIQEQFEVRTFKPKEPDENGNVTFMIKETKCITISPLIQGLEQESADGTNKESPSS